MKTNIRGLLLLAQRHLHLLDLISEDKIEVSDLKNRMEVEDAFLILEELIENIGIVQKDPTQLDQFLEIYCLRKS